jgi:3'-phosphoadenosine 5'-phosphosulfate sulfotransferase (PAPS reductase)/FAD synthetase
MSDPFKIKEPTCISFSGGRTSAYMLWRVLQSNGGLPDEAIVCFANTGKEQEATLEFVAECERQWNVPIKWLEYRKAEKMADRFQEVNFNTASRESEPFESLIQSKNYLPNTFARFCTSELKINVIDRYLKQIGWGEYITFVGVRADEPRRVSRIRGKQDGKETPLAIANVSSQDVQDFWKKQPFDLQLVTVQGNALLGNCDLCFMKTAAHKVGLIQDKPSRAIWWAEQEKKIGGLFREDHPSYSQMLKFSQQQTDLFDTNEEALSCFCGD